MKINDSIKNTAGLGLDKAGTGKLDSAAGKMAQTAPLDAKSAESVTLSPLSAQLKALEQKVASSSVFDAEKVDAIKSAIASGQFKVDAEKVADGLITSVKDLLTNQKP